ncbi:MAG: P1 family peptidase [Clostridiales bacterium]|nr:P1 family peptidase [Clostridiales bacterium]
MPENNGKFILPQGIRIGHANDDYTGVTCILTDRAVGGVSVRGGAPGTRETDMLRAEKSQAHVDAIVLSGGSAYGLEAACGVSDYLREKNIGFSIGDKVVPLVASAILFDLNTPGEYHYPDKAMGRAAAENAKADNIAFGAVGAGKGATVGKLFGLQNSCKSGIGGATLRFGNIFVSAVVAVNALGDVIQHRTGKVLAGAKLGGQFINTAEAMTDGRLLQMMSMQARTNTTIGCVMTNAKLDKVGVNKLAAASHDGLAMSIRPVHTDADGDTMFALSCGEEVTDINILMALSAEATAFAIEDAIKELQK